MTCVSWRCGPIAGLLLASLLGNASCAPSDPWYADADGDGYGRCGEGRPASEGRPGLADICGDCVDSVAAIHPGAPEICNHIDDDCDGVRDDEDPDLVADSQVWYFDGDVDGYGDEAGAPRCPEYRGQQWSRIKGDCDDTREAVHPGQTEDCDPAIDADCDGDPLNGVDPNHCLGGPDAEVVSDRTGSLGWSDALCCGDTNGDGFADLWYPATGVRDGGIVTMFEAIGPLSGVRSVTAGDVSIRGIEDNVASLMVGDVDADGVDDIVLGTPRSPDDLGFLVFRGPMTTDRTADDADGSVTNVITYWPQPVLGHFGVTEGLYAATEAYLDDDTSGVVVVPLSASGPVDASVDGIFIDDGSQRRGPYMGVGDLNGDGIDDLAIVRDYSIRGNPAFWVLDGPFDTDRSLGDEHTVDGPLPTGSWVTLATGDVNGDGLADLLVANPGPILDGGHRGAVYIFPGPIVGNDFESASSARLTGARYQRAGTSIVAVDLDADGRDEIGIGCTYPFPGAPGGALTVAHGPFLGEVDLGAEDTRATLNADAILLTGLGAADLVGDDTPDLLVSQVLPNEHGVGTTVLGVFDGARWP